jgi:hypothetical protein
MLAGWQLRKSENGILASYIVHVDPKGTIPNCITIVTVALIKTVQAQTPMCIATVANYLKDFGPLPFIVRRHPYSPESILLTHEELTDSEVDVKFKMTTGKLTLSLPIKTFASGFKVTTTKNVTVKIISADKRAGVVSQGHLLCFTSTETKEIMVEIKVEPAMETTVDGVPLAK